MEEKIIIKSEKYDVKKPLIIFLLIGLLIALIPALIKCSDIGSEFQYAKNTHEHDSYCIKEEYNDPEKAGEKHDIILKGDIEDEVCDCIFATYSNGLSFVLASYFGECFSTSIIIFVSFGVIGVLGYLWLRSYEMTVTDKRVYGKVAWGKRVDLPFDSISSTSTISLFKGVAVATSSGRISFLAVKNSAEIFDKINALLIERQKAKSEAASTQATAVQTDEVDKLKKFKELLDSGIITQEEFDAKKKELLGL